MHGFLFFHLSCTFGMMYAVDDGRLRTHRLAESVLSITWDRQTDRQTAFLSSLLRSLRALPLLLFNQTRFHLPCLFVRQIDHGGGLITGFFSVATLCKCSLILLKRDIRVFYVCLFAASPKSSVAIVYWSPSHELTYAVYWYVWCVLRYT